MRTQTPFARQKPLVCHYIVLLSLILAIGFLNASPYPQLDQSVDNHPRSLAVPEGVAISLIENRVHLSWQSKPHHLYRVYGRSDGDWDLLTSEPIAADSISFPVNSDLPFAFYRVTADAVVLNIKLVDIEEEIKQIANPDTLLPIRGTLMIYSSQYGFDGEALISDESGNLSLVVPRGITHIDSLKVYRSDAAGNVLNSYITTWYNVDLQTAYAQGTYTPVPLDTQAGIDNLIVIPVQTYDRIINGFGEDGVVTVSPGDELGGFRRLNRILNAGGNAYNLLKFFDFNNENSKFWVNSDHYTNSTYNFSTQQQDFIVGFIQTNLYQFIIPARRLSIDLHRESGNPPEYNNGIVIRGGSNGITHGTNFETQNVTWIRISLYSSPPLSTYHQEFASIMGLYPVTTSAGYVNGTTTMLQSNSLPYFTVIDQRIFSTMQNFYYPLDSDGVAYYDQLTNKTSFLISRDNKLHLVYPNRSLAKDILGLPDEHPF